MLAVDPDVSLVSERIYAYDDLSTTVQCLVRAYPEPQVEWLYRRTVNSAASERLSDPVLTKKTGPNQYMYTLIVCSFDLTSCCLSKV